MLSGHYDTWGRVVKWAALNVLTVAVLLVGYMPLAILGDLTLAEFSLLVVLPFSVVDLAEIIRGEEI